MKLSKTVAVVVALSAALCLTAGSAMASSQAQVLQKASQQVGSLIGEAEGTAMMKNVGLFKEAGLAYQPGLVAPRKGTLACKDKEQLRMLLGVYAFDANYAILFGQKKDFVSIDKLLRKDIPDHLGMADTMKVRALSQEQLKQIAADPESPASRAIYNKAALDNIHNWIAASAKDPEVVDVLVDAFYGSVIEALYVSCKLALAAGVGDKLVALFNEQSNRLEKTYKVLEAYAEDKELAKAVELGERKPLVKSIMDMLQAKKGKLTEADIKSILAKIEPVRNALVKTCN